MSEYPCANCDKRDANDNMHCEDWIECPVWNEWFDSDDELYDRCPDCQKGVE